MFQRDDADSDLSLHTSTDSVGATDVIYLVITVSNRAVTGLCFLELRLQEWGKITL